MESILTQTHTRAKSALFVLLCTAWLIPGLVGHDPWKADEPYSFGMVHHIFTTGDWVIPTVAGEPFMEKPPLFYITAAFIVRIFSPILPLHDAARLACALFMIVTFVFTAYGARELWGKGSGKVAVLILMGCVGLINHAHKLITDVSLLSGFAMALYGLMLGRRRWLVGGLWAGTGVGMGFMSKGLLAPGILGIFALVLPIWCREWRSRSYLLSLAAALVSVLPWLFVWPVALYYRAPHLLHEWLIVQNFGRFFGYAHQGPPNSPGFYLYTLPYFAFPALPLSVLVLWSRWKSGASQLRSFPLAAFIVMLAVLSLASDGRGLYALPFLLPLALLAAPAVGDFTPSSILAANRGIRAVTGILAMTLWLGWALLLAGTPSFVAAKLQAASPAYVPSFQPFCFAAALLLTIFWIAVEKYYPASGEGVVFRWTTGTALVWGLMMTIWLPFIDDSRSYRLMAQSLRKALPTTYACIERKSFGESERAMLDYFGGIRTIPLSNGSNPLCDLLLVSGKKEELPESIHNDWKRVWTGSRPGDKQLFTLYQSTATAPIAAPGNNLNREISARDPSARH